MTSSDRSHRDSLVEACLDLFQRRGFHGVGLAEILAASGAPRGSLYHYFPGGKEDLAVATIEKAAASVLQGLMVITQDVRSPVAAIHKVADFFADSLAASDFQKGCPVSTITLELAGENERISAACARAYAQWQDAIEAVLASAEIPNARATAEVLLMSLEGALILARARHDVGPLKQFKRFATRLLGEAK